MPPNLRPRKKSKAKNESPLTPQAIGAPNSTGFAALPPELLLEIVNHLPRFPVPCDFLSSPMQCTVYTRQGVLMIMVQLCRSFRSAFVQYLWEEVTLCSLHGGQRVTSSDPDWTHHSCQLEAGGACTSCEKRLAYEIVAQLETVTVRVPEYATRVQTLSIFIPKYSAKTIVPEFARCLALLPNLKTLQLHLDPHGPLLCQIIKRVFPKYRYENIRTLVVPCLEGSMTVIKACPNARHLHFTSTGIFQYLGVSPSVEKLTGVLPNWFYLRLRIVLPNLKHVQVRTGRHPPVRSQQWRLVEVLVQLPKLEVIEIALMRPEAKEEAEAMRKVADTVLAGMPNIPGTRRRAEICDYTDEPY
ncbi:hypothetical protein BDN72DRAFT_848995 [Pluteus cervinus]|uniref:Uncharacterized protein n=1 Tax=Pluteus cervinus TaxID=181527 RepID=A0ACD3A8V4_9AGAR|nr:hypothetical protein BDN72DRAFT_848995 [Pluteus cervinus]